jgi:uncharacterized membrane protein YciS (DUF1049 family)
MSCTFALGLLLGWLLWGFGYAKKLKQLSADANFWQQNLEQTRRAHNDDLMKIEQLVGEKQNLKKRLAALQK